MSRTSPPRRTRRPFRGRAPVLAALAFVVVVGGLAAWTAGAFDGDDDVPDGFPTTGSEFVVPLGAPVDEVAGVQWPRDDAGQPRAATAVEEPQPVRVTAADEVVLATRSQTILLHQRDGRVTAVDLQPQDEAGSATDAIDTLRRLLDDHGLLDRTTAGELTAWESTDLDPDPLLGDTPSVRVSGGTASVLAQLRPVATGGWYVTVEVALPMDDQATSPS